MGQFMLGLHGQPGEETANAQNAALVEGEKVEALQETTTAPQQPYAAIISRHAQELGVPEALAHAVVQVESNYRAKCSRPGWRDRPDADQACHGARHRLFGQQRRPSSIRRTNIRYGMRYLARAQQLAGGDLCGTNPALQCGPRRQAHEPHLVQLLQRVQRIMAGA